jgi:hypothetical protein
MKPPELAGFFCGFSSGVASRSQLAGDWIQQHFSIDSNDPSIASLRQKLIKARGQEHVYPRMVTRNE